MAQIQTATTPRALAGDNTLVRNTLRKGRVFGDRNDAFPVAAISTATNGASSTAMPTESNTVVSAARAGPASPIGRASAAVSMRRGEALRVVAERVIWAVRLGVRRLLSGASC